MGLPRRGLARRIYSAFLAAAVIPTAIAGLIGVTVSLSTLRTQTLAHLQQEVSARASGVQLFFDCPRRPNFDPPCRLNFDPGRLAEIA